MINYNIPKIGLKEFLTYPFELGYKIWNYLLVFLGANELILNLGNTILFFILLDSTIKKIIKKRVIFYFFYCFAAYLILNMAIIRQGISISLFYFSIPFLLKKQKKGYLILVMACFFHISSIIYFLIVYISKKKYKKTFFNKVFLIGVIIFTLRIPFIFFIVNLIGKITFA